MKRSVGAIRRMTITPNQVMSHSRKRSRKVKDGGAEATFATSGVVAALTRVLYRPANGLQSVHVGEQVRELPLVQDLPKALHVAASGEDDLAHPFVVGRQSTLG